MKPRILLSAILFFVLLVSCSDRELAPVAREETGERRGILFHMTKGGILSPSGLCVTALSQDGSAVYLNKETLKDASGDECLVGGFWAEEPLSFYAVSPYITMTPEDDGIIINAGTPGEPLTGTEDILTASAVDVQPTLSAVPLTFGHILARLQDVVLQGSEDSVAFTVTSLSFSSPLYGSLDIISGDWLTTGDQQTRTIVSSSVSLGQEGTDTLSVNLSAIPCTSTLRVTYTATRGEYSNTYSKHAQFTLTAGNATALTAILTDDATPLELGEDIAVIPWDDGGTLPIAVAPEGDIVVVPDILNFPPEGWTLSFTVSADGDWTISCDAPWVSLSVGEGPVEAREEVFEITSSDGSYAVPEWAQYMDIFLVNAGNAGTAGTSSAKAGPGGAGGNTLALEDIAVDGGTLSITIGQSTTTSGGKGGQTTLTYGSQTYSPDAQGENTATGAGADGTAAPDWTGHSELFGASGGAGATSGSAKAGGTTGGGKGGVRNSYTNTAATAGSFYGAGGGGGAFYSGTKTTAQKGGYQGIAIIRFRREASTPEGGTEGSGVGTVYVTVGEIGDSPERTALVTVTSGSKTATVTVNQSKGPAVDVGGMDDEGGYNEEL